MKRICAWCGVHLDGAREARVEAPISHGICPGCERGLSGHLGIPIRRFIDSLGAPVMLVDVEGGGRVVSANTPVLDATDGHAETVYGGLLGEVFECRNASLPGGCGHTVHCSGCVIRSAVEHTWATGEASVRVPATLQQGGDQAISMLISTERVGDRVLLRIDRPPSPSPDPGSE